MAEKPPFLMNNPASTGSSPSAEGLLKSRPQQSGEPDFNKSSVPAGGRVPVRTSQYCDPTKKPFTLKGEGGASSGMVGTDPED